MAKQSFSCSSGHYQECSSWLSLLTTGWSPYTHTNTCSYKCTHNLTSLSMTSIAFAAQTSGSFHPACFWSETSPNHTHCNSSVQSLLCCQSTGNTDTTQRCVQYVSVRSIIAPPVSSGWFLAPTPWPPVGRSPWARPFARSGPLSPRDSPETSRSSTLGFSALNLKQNTSPDTR